MEEQQRLAYLQAMGITQWTLRGQEAIGEQPLVQAPLAQESSVQVSVVQEATLNQQETAVDVKRVRSSNDNLEQSSAAEPRDNSVAVDGPAISPTAVAAEPDLSKSAETSVASTQRNSKYLVLPNNRQWQERPIAILCRHSGQPAESFYHRQRPSKTVANISQALVALAEDMGQNIESQINFALVADTALSEQARSLDDVKQSCQPQAFLVMGEAAANQLLEEQRSFAEWQLKTWKTKQDIPFVVTYHPFDIFNNPSVKQVVQQDLIRLLSLLSND
ncbi:MAG: hypothetical protein V2I33_06830 [Kangiellaceae bacterium]|jgi:DNA polymerase III psi subunit|nr:hypothetical protein [Kangiellaceae bacterium]